MREVETDIALGNALAETFGGEPVEATDTTPRERTRNALTEEGTRSRYVSDATLRWGTRSPDATPVDDHP